jgi:hypothetical protein
MTILQIETLLQFLGSAAIVQLVATKLLYAEVHNLFLSYINWLQGCEQDLHSLIEYLFFSDEILHIFMLLTGSTKDP